MDNLVVGISTSALFDFEEENKIYEEKGFAEYLEYQIAHEKEILKPGAGFQLAKALTKINSFLKTERKIELIIMSRNGANTSIRIFNSIEYHGLEISRAAFLGGAKLTPYLHAFSADLFLSTDGEDVNQALNAGIAAGIICTYVKNGTKEIDRLKLSFDVNSIKFADEAERIYQNYGMAAFIEYEKINIQKTFPEGPFAKMFKTFSVLQKDYPAEKAPIRISLISGVNSPEYERVIHALRAWDVRVDEAFYIGESGKDGVLKAFGANIFFNG